MDYAEDVYPTELYYFLGNISSVQMSAIFSASLGKDRRLFSALSISYSIF